MLSQWARSINTFETTVKRISEPPDLVCVEIEERHVRNQRAHIVNSITVFEFNADATSPSTCNSPGDGTAGALF